MEQTLFAAWLDQTFYAFDAAILGFYHSLAEWGGGFFTPFMKLISLLGEKGLFFILIALGYALLRALGSAVFSKKDVPKNTSPEYKNVYKK
jgi:hypothetical protein